MQALIGLITAIYGIAERVFLADITQKVSRGTDIGRYVMIIGILSSTFTLIGGLFVGIIPFRLAFALLGIVFIIDTIPLFFLSEEKRNQSLCKPK